MAEDRDQVGILKSMWRKNEAGKWINHGMKGVELKARDGEEKDFFRIKDRTVPRCSRMFGRELRRALD